MFNKSEQKDKEQAKSPKLNNPVELLGLAKVAFRREVLNLLSSHNLPKVF
jgi:hypothetical protein